MDCYLCWIENTTLHGLVLFVILPLWFDRVHWHLVVLFLLLRHMYVGSKTEEVISRMLFSLPVSGINSLYQHERHLTMSFFKVGDPSCAGFPIYLYLLRCTKACWADYGNLVTSGWNIKVKLPCFTSVTFVNIKSPNIDYPRNFHLPDEESLLSSWPTAFRVCLPSWSLQNLVWPSGHACRLDFLTLEWKNRLWV